MSDHVPTTQFRRYEQPQSPEPVIVGWRCGSCGFVGMPAHSSSVSTVGWVVFAFLLICTCLLAPVGLLIREERTWCPHCLKPGA
jgi:hypothetical protein